MPAPMEVMDRAARLWARLEKELDSSTSFAPGEREELLVARRLLAYLSDGNPGKHLVLHPRLARLAGARIKK